MVDARIYSRCESQAYRIQFMIEEAKRYCGAWINSQPSLFPWLEEELDPLTAKLERLVIILDTLGLEAFVASPSWTRSAWKPSWRHRRAGAGGLPRTVLRSPAPSSPRPCSTFQ